MDTEYEIKILDINADELTKKLLELGFEQQPPQPFKRYVYNVGTEGNWARLRTDGTKTALTYKSFTKDAIDGVKELEITVSDFEKTNQLMKLLGFTPTTYQENRRRNFIKDDTEISVDEWPHIPPYLEIEAKDQATVEDYVQKLGLVDSKKTSEPTSKVYELYGLDIDSYDRLAFET